MIYLTFDSNIWIYSLDQSWQIENELDYLEPWIKRGDVKLLLPKIIIDEWKKHEQDQVKNREDKLKEFFQMAEEILPSSFFAEYKQPVIQKKIIEEQLNRAKQLIFQSEIIPEYPEVKDRIIKDGIAKKAPLHKKSSIADAMIVFSLIEFARLNPGNHYFFVSGNTDDFFKKGDENKSREIHDDLKPDFDSNNIQAFNKLHQLRKPLQDKFGLVVDNIDQIRSNRIRNKLKEQAYNPEYEKLIESGQSSFIQNVNMIELILKEKKPTKEQVIFVLALIDSDIAYEDKFYQQLDKVNWFEILKRKGVFKPSNNPAPVQSEKGFSIPLWGALNYLEQISNQIKEPQHKRLVNDIIAIIEAISKKPVDNYKTWRLVIKILSNLPTENVSESILDFMPVWLSGNFDTVPQTLAICENLLPHFIPHYPNADEIHKAELILRHIFSIEKTELKDLDQVSDSGSYFSKMSMHFLSEAFIGKGLAEKVAVHCSNNVILLIADNLKKLRFDFPIGINISLKTKDKSYGLKAEIIEEDLRVHIFNDDTPKECIWKRVIKDFESLKEGETKGSIIAILAELKVEYEESQENELNLRMLINAVTNGAYFVFYEDSISKLDDEYRYGDKPVEVFSLIFRDLLNYKAKQKTLDGIDLLKLFAFENKYRLSFFRKTVLFIVGENWHFCKELFWDLVKDNDLKQIFSNQFYHNDLYELLSKVQTFLQPNEIVTLQKIIELGPQGRDEDDMHKDHDGWKLRWYAALKDNSGFKEQYELLSKKKNRTSEDFENRSIIRRGSTSPFTTEELLEKSNEEIVKFIHQFNPENHWEEPTIDGLSNIIGKAIEKEPQKFANQIELYSDVAYSYSYHMALGFEEAWQKQRGFDWEKVLNFFKSYITSEKFISGKLELNNDRWGVKSDWVVGAIGNLLSKGMKSDDQAFELSLLPIAKDILQILVKNLKHEDIRENNLDYPTYSLNSTGGKMLRSLLDYSLRRARNLKQEDRLPKWEPEIKKLFEEAQKKGVIDTYILTGWYFQQFFFLDHEWITDRIKGYYDLGHKEWIAFISGFAFSNPPFNKEIYQLFYPHYLRAINADTQLKKATDHGIIRHLVSFYFWEYEDLQSKGLLWALINKRNHQSILDLVHFIWQQDQFLNDLDRSEAEKIESLVVQLWQVLSKMYEGATVEMEQRVLTSFINLLEYVPELNEEITSLILKSINSTIILTHGHSLIENLIRLKDKGYPDKTAIYIATILNEIYFSRYISSPDDQHISELTIFLYQNNQKAVADAFCNKMAKQGHIFLTEIYKMYQ
jgi:hypothetical protein